MFWLHQFVDIYKFLSTLTTVREIHSLTCVYKHYQYLLLNNLRVKLVINVCSPLE